MENLHLEGGHWKQMPISECQKIIRHIKALDDDVKIKENLESLLENQPLLNLEFGYGSNYWRGRKCQIRNGYNNSKELFCPPSERMSLGRLNNPGEQILYLASRKYTALKEIDSKKNDYIHLVAYRIKKNEKMKICLIGDFFNVYRTGFSMLSPEISESLHEVLNSFDYDLGRSIIYVDAFLASVLRTPKKESKNYKLTRILGSLLLNKIEDVNSIFYPSVAQEGGMNLAMKPFVAENKLEIVLSAVLLIEREFEFGIYNISKVMDCVEIDKDGSLKLEMSTSSRAWSLLVDD